MVETVVDRLEDRLDLAEITDPAGIGIDLALDVDRHAERMAMKTPALVALRYMGQEMGGFEGEFFKEFHGNTHGLEKTAPV
ncbi:hypothetical protein D3C80_1510970 [compost metagenome]